MGHNPLGIDPPFSTAIVSDDETMVVNRLRQFPPPLFELPEDWPGRSFQNAYY